MQSIMVPLDGSPFGEHALAPAVSLARRSGAVLHLVHVASAPPVSLAWDGLGGIDPFWQERELSSGADYITRATASLERTGIDVRVRLLEAPVVEALADYAVQAGIDLIVMSTHGRGGLSRAWLGSVADGLIRATDRPLLLVRPEAPGPKAGDRAFTQVIVPLDGSAFAEAAIASAVEIASLCEASLDLVSVQPPPLRAVVPYSADSAAFDPDAHRLERERLTSYLGDCARAVSPSVAEVRSKVLTDANPATAILEYAEELNADLLAIATHGRGGVARWALGSVADKLVRAGGRAVLVVRPESEASRARPADAAGAVMFA